MPKKDLIWTPFLFFIYRDIYRFYKVKVQTILSPLISQALYLIIFGVSLGKTITISDQFSYLQFIIPGLIAMTLLNQSFQNGSSSIFSMKITGEIIDIKSTALNMQQIIFGVAISGLVRGLVVSVLTFILGLMFHYYYEGYFFTVHSYSWLFAFLILGGVVFSMMGFSIGIWSRTFDHISSISIFIMMPLISLGGAFFDLDTLSPFWQKISLFNPVLYFINGIRYSLLGVADVPVIRCFVLVFLSAFLVYGIALRMSKTGTFQKIF